MGPKKRAGGSSSKNSSPSLAKKAAEAAAAALEEKIKNEIERAEKAFTSGNDAKAVRIMQDLSTRHENSAKVHHAHASLLSRKADLFKDPTIRKGHLKNAVAPALQAISLSPNSLEYAHLYPKLLFELASDAEEHEAVIRRCELILERLRDGQFDESTPESKVEELRKNLSQMKARSRVIKASLRLNFRVDEVKELVATSSAKGKRQVTEAKLEEARVSQEILESIAIQEQGELLSRGAIKLEERKQIAKAKKLTSLGNRILEALKVWLSFNSDYKRRMLQIRVSSLRKYLTKVPEAAQVFSEAIKFGEQNMTWKFIECYVCDEKYRDIFSYLEHFAKEQEFFSPRLSFIVPEQIDSDWLDIIMKCRWKPADILAVFQITEDELKFRSDGHSGSRMLDMDSYLLICHIDRWESYFVERVKELFDEEELEEWMITYQDEQEGGSHEPEETRSKWPLSDDPQRAAILEGIQATFRKLLRRKYLTRRHILQVIHYILEELQIFASESQIRNLGLDDTPLGICLLGLPQLEKIQKYLQSLTSICSIAKSPENDMVVVTVGLTSDASCLYLDQSVARKDIDPNAPSFPMSDFVDAVGSAINYENFGGHLVPWLFADAPAMEPSTKPEEYSVIEAKYITEQIQSWWSLTQSTNQKVKRIFDFLREEFYLLERLCDRKIMHSLHEETLKKIESICDDESNRRAQDPNYVPQCHEQLLENRKKELEVVDVDDLTMDDSLELNLLSNILEQVCSWKATKLVPAEHLIDKTSSSLDQNLMKETETIIDEAFRHSEMNFSLEICRTEAIILGTLIPMWQLASCSYRSVIVNLIKSYFRTHLELLANNVAVTKSDIAAEKLLAELDNEKNINTGDDTKQKQKKSKDKKKHKYKKKAKKQGAGGSTQLPPLEEDAGQEQLMPQAEVEAEHSELGGRTTQHFSDDNVVGVISKEGFQIPSCSADGTSEVNPNDSYIIQFGTIPLMIAKSSEKLSEEEGMEDESKKSLADQSEIPEFSEKLSEEEQLEGGSKKCLAAQSENPETSEKLSEGEQIEDESRKKCLAEQSENPESSEKLSKEELMEDESRKKCLAEQSQNTESSGNWLEEELMEDESKKKCLTEQSENPESSEKLSDEEEMEDESRKKCLASKNPESSQKWSGKEWMEDESKKCLAEQSENRGSSEKLSEEEEMEDGSRKKCLAEQSKSTEYSEKWLGEGRIGDESKKCLDEQHENPESLEKLSEEGEMEDEAWKKYLAEQSKKTKPLGKWSEQMEDESSEQSKNTESSGKWSEEEPMEDEPKKKCLTEQSENPESSEKLSDEGEMEDEAWKKYLAEQSKKTKPLGKWSEETEDESSEQSKNTESSGKLSEEEPTEDEPKKKFLTGQSENLESSEKLSEEEEMEDEAWKKYIAEQSKNTKPLGTWSEQMEDESSEQSKNTESSGKWSEEEEMEEESKKKCLAEQSKIHESSEKLSEEKEMEDESKKCLGEQSKNPESSEKLSEEKQIEDESKNKCLIEPNPESSEKSLEELPVKKPESS